MPHRALYSADLHVHTVASAHAYSTVNEYAQHAKTVGIRLFAMTDHGPALPAAPHPWHFGNLRVIPHVLYGVGVLRGIEANILEDGLDCPDEILNELDIVLAGFHQPCIEPQSIEKNTELMIRTIESGKVHIISHPGNPEFPVDPEAVAAAAVKHNVALEVNNASFKFTRKGSFENCIALIRAHGKAGGLVTLGSDAHHTHSMGQFDEALKIVEAAHFPEEHIINTSPENVLLFLEQHGKDFRKFLAFFERQ